MIKYLILVLTFLLSINSFGQSKGVNLGLGTYGVGFGCLPKQNGIKLNLWDKECGDVNGLNVSFNSGLRKISGVTIGLLIADDSIVNGIQLGTIASGAGKMNGISIGGLIAGGKVVNGLMIAGLGLAADSLNGVFISGTGSKYWNTDSISVIDGVTMGIIGGAFTKRLNGISIGLFHNVTGVQKGVTISAFNRTRELHGIQIG